MRNQDHINVFDGPMVNEKPQGIQLALSNSIEGDRGNYYKPETWESSLEVSAKIHAVHQALAEKAGIKIERSSVSLERHNGMDTYLYKADATHSPNEIKEKLAKAAEDVGSSPAELAKLSARVDEIHSKKEHQKLEFNDSNPKLQALFQGEANSRKQDGRTT